MKIRTDVRQTDGQTDGRTHGRTQGSQPDTIIPRHYRVVGCKATELPLLKM